MLPEDKFLLGDAERCWSRYCGFLDLSVEEFMAIQERLLLEQIELVAPTPIAQKLMPQGKPRNVEEFRRTVPLTTYGDYEPFLGKQDEKALAVAPLDWCHTSGYGGRFKWVPFTQRMAEVQCRHSIACWLLGAANKKGEVNVRPGARLLINVGPRPYLTGTVLSWLQKQVTLRLMPSLEEAERLGFREGVAKSFQIALNQGVDVVFSISSVLVRVGETMAEGRPKGAPLPRHPRAIYTLARGLWHSRREKRHLLPRDLWKPQAILTGGSDTAIYRDSILHYWGRPPYEVYAATEGGLLALQAGDKGGLIMLPDGVFWEFIPEAEARRYRQEPRYRPPTKLFSELEVGQSYEVVLTQLYGMPLLRYLLGDIITVVAKGEEGIALPQIVFKARADEIIDLGGLTELDEKSLWRALSATGLKFQEWSARKEFQGPHSLLHLFLELKEELGPEEVARRMDEGLREVVVSYHEVEPILGFRPVQVTLLTPGTFQRYYQEREREGAAIGHLKPPHMRPSEAVIQSLLRLSQEGGKG